MFNTEPYNKDTWKEMCPCRIDNDNHVNRWQTGSNQVIREGMQVQWDMYKTVCKNKYSKMQRFTDYLQDLQINPNPNPNCPSGPVAGLGLDEQMNSFWPGV